MKVMTTIKGCRGAFDLRRRRVPVGPIAVLSAAMSLLASLSGVAQTRPALFEHVEEISLPSRPGAHEPSLTNRFGTLYLSWMEHGSNEDKIFMAIRDVQGWSEPRLVHQGDDLFVNWADFPGIAVFDDGTIAVQWLREIGPASFDYQIEIGLSHDGGRSWNEPLIPHEDRSFVQHGFVSMLPTQPDALAVIWLDGRAYRATNDQIHAESDAMQLRATTLSRDGVLGRDVAIDLRTCSCCQTSLAAASEGTILAAYRDRSDGEIRDISVARLTAGGWQKPVSVHDDGWELSGCPVNGPALDANDETVAVAWFTGANDVAAVNVSFSDDAARSFGAPVRIDRGDPVGRVDLELLDDGTALVSWIEWNAGAEALFVCRVERETGCIQDHLLATNSSGASMNFPRMTRIGRDLYIAWTQPDETGDDLALRRAVLSEIDRP